MTPSDDPRPAPLPRTRSTIWWVLALAAVAAAAGLFWRGEHKSAPAEHNTVVMSRSPL